VNAVVSAWAIGRASHAFRMSPGSVRCLIWNPVSLFFAATHFKESITESLVLVFVGALYGSRQIGRALGWCCAVVLFRFSYAAVLVSLVAIELFGVGGWPTIRVLWGLAVVLLCLPDIHADSVDGLGTGLFGRLAGYAWGRKVVAPFLGLLLPVPFQGLFRFAGIGPWEWFTAVYGCVYHWAGWRIWAGWSGVQSSQTARRIVNGVVCASLLIGYLFLGGPGVKDRYFAPFVAVLILAVGVAERDRCGGVARE
jgi:hypothetical protein